jgi:5-methyltetrahydrofolate--homocysteine methyltransferase
MILIGEKLNGSIPAMKKAIAEKNEDYIRDMAKKQSEAGADFLDVCASVPEDKELEILKWLIDLVQGVTDTPICVDSPSARICAEAIGFCKKPGLINSVSGEGDKINLIFPAIAGTSWQCIALLSDDKGIPRTTERRLEVFDAIMEKAAAHKIPPQRLYIDPLIEMLAASEDGIVKVTDTIKEVKKRFPAIHVTGGASNISFNLPARNYINQAFMILAMNAGMDSAIMDPMNKDMMGLIFATEALLGQDEFCLEFIGAFRSGRFGG